MEFLWTDVCFLTVLFLLFLLIITSLRKKHIRLALAHLLYKPLAVSSGIVLLFFLVIGVMDSIRFHLDSLGKEPKSLLDHLLTPLETIYEKTYSAPMSLYLYSAEVRIHGGIAEQVYPRLSYPSRIKNDQDKKKFIIKTLYKVSTKLFCIVFLLWGLMVIIKRFFYRRWLFSLNSSELSALLTTFVCIFFILSSYCLSRELHFLGTGKIGQDIFYQTVKSIHTGLIIGILTTLFMLPLALFLGIAAGYFGGIVDDIIQYSYTTLSSIPGVLLITASVLSMQTYIANHPQQFATLAKNADARLLALCFILGVTSWTNLCRLLRAETLKLKALDYLLAARALGSSTFTIIRKHLIPNVMHIVLITLILDFSFLILAEAVLSYVGVGVSPLTISWGNMINGARLELAREPIVWWPIMSAFVFMFLIVLSSNLFGDSVRETFSLYEK